MCTGLFSSLSVSCSKIWAARLRNLIWFLLIQQDSWVNMLSRLCPCSTSTVILFIGKSYRRYSPFQAEMANHHQHLAKGHWTRTYNHWLCLFLGLFVFPRWTAIITERLKDTLIQMSASALALVSGMKDILHHITVLIFSYCEPILLSVQRCGYASVRKAILNLLLLNLNFFMFIGSCFAF